MKYNNMVKSAVSRPAGDGGKAKRPAMVMKTASWGALPGKAQPRARDAGMPRVKAYVKSAGL